MSEAVKHPGEFIAEYLDKEGMSQKELAIRTGVTEKHINTLINGHKNITDSFAQKLGYVFECTQFWIEKQQKYDNDILLKKQEAGVTNEEEEILKRLNDIINYWEKKGLIDKSKNVIEMIVDVRRLLKTSNLSYISKFVKAGAFRAEVSKNVQIDPCILYAWQRTCEMIADRTVIEKKLDINLLKENLNEIKVAMKLKDINYGIKTLKETFAECGIIFDVIENFKGAPVQGFIKLNDKEQLILFLTIRRKRADTFWFTLFHEIGHILYQDYNTKFVDFETIDNQMESRADNFAKDFLIDKNAYKNFIQNTNNFSKSAIETFAFEQDIQPFIVVGRLQNDKVIDWSEHNDMLKYYKWA